MPMVFPTSPAVGQVFTSGGRSWVWTGSTWDSPSSATAALSGLTLIKSQAIGTAVASVTVTDAFSATYDTYQIIVAGGAATANTGMKIHFGSITSGYRWALIYQVYGSPSVLAASNSSATGVEFIGVTTPNKLASVMTVYDPFLTRNTTVTGPYLRGDEGGFSHGILNDNNSYASFTISTQTGTMTGGTINVYGYRKA